MWPARYIVRWAPDPYACLGRRVRQRDKATDRADGGNRIAAARRSSLDAVDLLDELPLGDDAFHRRKSTDRRQRMNVAKAVLCVLLVLLVTMMVPSQVWGQSGAPGTELHRVVPRDTETMVSSASQSRLREGEGELQCSPNGIPALELVTPPKHGSVRFVFADLGVPKGLGCINSVYGQ